MNQPVEDAGGSTFYLCIVLVTPEVDGHRMQVGMNWRFNVELSPSHMGLLHEEPLRSKETFEHFNKSIINSRSN